MMWAIYAIYEQVLGRVRCPADLSEVITITIGLMQGCLLSRTLFGKVANYITQGVGN